MLSGKVTVKKKAKKMCPYCYQIVYQGCRHKCGALRRARNILEQTSELEQERIANNVLNKKLDEAEVEGSDDGKNIKLRTFGRPSLFNVRKGRIRRRRYHTYNLIKRAKISAGMTGRQTNKFMAHLRHGVGRGWIASRVREQMVEENKIFDEDFEAGYTQMEMNAEELKATKKSGEKAKRTTTVVMKPLPLVFAKDMDTFIEKVRKERGDGVIDNYYLKVGIDDGRNMLKVNISLVPKDFDGKEKNQEKDLKILEGFKLTGVKRLMIVACAPVKESITNLRIILNKIKLHTLNIPNIIVADLCCINKLLGLGNHKSKFPCYICYWNAYDQNGQTKGVEKRTFGSLEGSMLAWW